MLKMSFKPLGLLIPVGTLLLVRVIDYSNKIPFHQYTVFQLIK